MTQYHNPLIARCGGFALFGFVRAMMNSMDVRGMLLQPEVDPASPWIGQRGIYVFWHEYITIPFFLRGHCDIAMLLSRHRDAEWLAHAARYMGFDTVRGSSNWGSTAALKQLLKVSETKHLAITPDGPRGPRRRMAPGPIYLASKLQLPLIPMGFGFNRPWRLKTWDRFAVPKPGSRARCIMGPAIQIPPGLEKSEVEWHRQWVEGQLNHLTTQAEKWAESGLRGEGEIATLATPTPLESSREARKTEIYWRSHAQNRLPVPGAQSPTELRIWDGARDVA